MGGVNAKEQKEPELDRRRYEWHKEEPAGAEYKHDPLQGFPDGRKPRGIPYAAYVFTFL